VVDADASIGPFWRKSSWSAGNGSCVEVAELSEHSVGVRNSRDNSEGCPVLAFDRTEWEAFITDIRAGGFDPDK
jgi:hypothetical protein